MSDYFARYFKEQKQKADAARRTLIRELRSAGVERVEVDFDGYGDSGSIEGIAFTPSVKNIEEKEVPDTAFEFTEWRNDKPKKVKRNKTIRELIDDVCYGILGTEHGGWEINEGSFGNFVFRVDDDKVLVTFNQRIESVETSEEEY
jgi:hypothetical protein